jgi:hypothetical protein
VLRIEVRARTRVPAKKKGAVRRPFRWLAKDQPFEARALRRLLPVSLPVPLLAPALLPPVPELAALPAPAPVVELDAPDVPDELLAPEPMLLPLFDAPAPDVPAAPPLGFAAPISPADVPGPMRPALSASAGDPCAAYAPATAADMQPATKATMSLFIRTSREKLSAATSPHGRGQRGLASDMPASSNRRQEPLRPGCGATAFS